MCSRQTFGAVHQRDLFERVANLCVWRSQPSAPLRVRQAKPGGQMAAQDAVLSDGYSLRRNRP